MNSASVEAYISCTQESANFIKNIELNSSVSRGQAYNERNDLLLSLDNFVDKWGNPRSKNTLKDLEVYAPFQYNIFISIFDKTGKPIQSVARPLDMRFVYNGSNIEDTNEIMRALYSHLQKYNQFPKITEIVARKAFKSISSPLINKKWVQICTDLSQNGWALEGTKDHYLSFVTPIQRYIEGDLWKRYDFLHKILSPYGDTKGMEKKSSQIKKVIEPIYQKQWELLTRINKNGQSFMNLATFPELLEQRKLYPSTSFIPISVVNGFFHSLRSFTKSYPKRIRGVSRLLHAKIRRTMDGKKVYIVAPLSDIYGVFEEVFEKNWAREGRDIPTYPEMFADYPKARMVMEAELRSKIKPTTISKMKIKDLDLIEKEFPELVKKFRAMKEAKPQEILRNAYPNIAQDLIPYHKKLDKFSDDIVSFRVRGKNWQDVRDRMESYKEEEGRREIALSSLEIKPHMGFASLLQPEQQHLYGMLIHDANIFKPSFNKQLGMYNTKLFKEENIYGAKVRIRQEIEDKFLSYLAETKNEKHWENITDSYNRRFRGYVEPNFAQGEDIVINGWKGYQLREYQVEAVRKLIYNREGLLAFDVGLGKTLTGIATIAMAKQQGWCQRPVILVPNSILFKWKDDILSALPDWKIVTIGANQYHDADGNLKSKTDTPKQRGEKWIQFSLGAYDVVLLTYSMLERTQFRESTYDMFKDKHLAKEAGIYDQLRKARGDEKSEAKILKQKLKIQGQIADMLLPPKSQRVFDAGVTWEDIGIDLLLVDESQNFKNLFIPDTDFNPPPKFLGANKPSKQSYNLDIRCMQVRNYAQAKYKSNNIFLLSATPAKNSPIEFYNLLQYIDPRIFSQYGIGSSTDFFSRFLHVEHDVFFNSRMELLEYPQVRSFTNLDEFRGILERYANFQVKETIEADYPYIDLQVPQPINHKVEIKPSQIQTELIKEILYKMGKVEIDEFGNVIQTQVPKEEKISALEGIMQMLAVCIHPILLEDRFKIEDEEAEDADIEAEIASSGGKKKKKKKKRMSIPLLYKEVQKIDAHSPKLDAIIENIIKREDTTCGNIIFVQNIAVQFMLQKLLIAAGIPQYTIGIMNSPLLPDPQSRQNMAKEFNFVTEYLVHDGKIITNAQFSKMPKNKQPNVQRINGYRYNIIIANSIAYEGIDLQKRTCAIHHCDLAWEPATITQRNGRGVRSGNKYESVDIYYYLIEKSVDQYIYLTIQGKRSWLVSAIQSQEREINNLGASETSAETILLLSSSSEAEYQQRKALAQKIKKEKELIKTRSLIASQIHKASLLYYEATKNKNQQALEKANIISKKLEAYDKKLQPALYYIDYLRNEIPFTYTQRFLSDVILFPGMLYTFGDDSPIMFLGTSLQLDVTTKYDKKVPYFEILILKEDNEDGYQTSSKRTVKVSDVVASPCMGDLLKNICRAYPYMINTCDIGVEGESAGVGYKEALTKYITEPVIEDEKKYEVAKMERKQAFYRWLLEKGYLQFIDPKSQTGDRTHNVIFNTVSFNYRRSYNTDNQLKTQMKIFLLLPIILKQKMWQQGFLLRMFSGNMYFSNYIFVYNKAKDRVFVTIGITDVDDYTTDSEVIKDGYTYRIPTSIKPTMSITAENYKTILTDDERFTYALYSILKEKGATSKDNSMPLQTLASWYQRVQSTYGWKSKSYLAKFAATLEDPTQSFFKSKNIDFIRQVLGIRAFTSVYGDLELYIEPSKPIKPKGYTLLDIELFEPNMSGFERCLSLLKAGKYGGLIDAKNMMTQFLYHYPIKELNKTQKDLINKKNSTYFSLAQHGFKLDFCAILSPSKGKKS